MLLQDTTESIGTSGRRNNTDLSCSAYPNDPSKVDASGLDPLENEIQCVEPHANGGGHSTLVWTMDGAVGRAIRGEVSVVVYGCFVDDG